MDSIQVNTANLKAKAGEVERLAEEYKGHYDELFNEVTNLTTTDWKGEDAEAFKKQIEGFKDDFDKMKQLMLDYADFLGKAADNYDNTRGNIIAEIHGLQN